MQVHIVPSDDYKLGDKIQLIAETTDDHRLIRGLGGSIYSHDDGGRALMFDGANWNEGALTLRETESVEARERRLHREKYGPQWLLAVRAIRDAIRQFKWWPA